MRTDRLRDWPTIDRQTDLGVIQQDCPGLIVLGSFESLLHVWAYRCQ